MYLGNQPALSYTSFAKQDFTTSATTSYTLDNPVANANELALFINFVRQEPTTAYSASNTSLTLTSATSATDDMYCVFLGKAVQTVNPPNASVGLSQLTATGTKNSTTFLRGDNTFASAGGDNTPAFFAYLSADQSVGDSATVKVNINSEVYDTDNCYDNSTNYRFTPTTSGKYLVSANLEIDSGGGVHDITAGYSYLYKNGSEYARARFDPNADVFAFHAGISVPVVMNGTTDYLEIYTYVDTTGGTQHIEGDSTVARSWFSAIKIIE
jgi:hypothetical protein